MVSLYDILRLTGIFGAIGAAAGWDHSNHGVRLSTLGGCLVAAGASIGAAWAATKATMWIARAKSETLLWVAYVGTFVTIIAAGATAGVMCRHLLDSL